MSREDELNRYCEQESEREHLRDLEEDSHSYTILRSGLLGILQEMSFRELDLDLKIRIEQLLDDARRGLIRK